MNHSFFYVINRRIDNILIVYTIIIWQYNTTTTRPSKRHISVQRYVPPVEFDQWRTEALSLGFKVSGDILSLE